MKKTSIARIKRILEKHCVMVTAEFFRACTDTYGDITGYNKYAEYPLYFSQLLHRYAPYVGIKTSDVALTRKRYTPMAIVLCSNSTDIKEFDMAKIDGNEYTVSFVENVKGYYLLLSLVDKKEESDD